MYIFIGISLYRKHLESRTKLKMIYVKFMLHYVDFNVGCQDYVKNVNLRQHLDRVQHSRQSNQWHNEKHISCNDTKQ